MTSSLAEILQDGLFIDGDWVESKDQDPAGDVRLIQLADIGDGVFRDKSARFLTLAKARELRCTFLKPGDVLVARMPEPLGRACVFPAIDQPAVTAVDVCILRPNPNRVSAAWLAKAINSPEFRDSMQQFVRGTTRQRISRKNLGLLTIEVPPLPEQVRLTQVIEALETRRYGAARHAGMSHRAIGVLKQAIFVTACSGQLTVDWRDVHPDVLSVEHALAAQQPPRRRRKVIDQPIDLGLPDLPDSYILATIGQAAQLIEYGTSQRTEAVADDGIPILGMGNIQKGRLDLSRLKFHPLDQEIEKLLLQDGDLLFNRTNSPELVGKSAVYRGQEPMSYASYLIRVRFAPDICDPDFANYWINSAWGRAWAQLVKTDGVSQSNINGTKLSLMPLPLPPIEEQREIVRRASKLLSTADRLSTRIEDARRAIGRSSQSILAKAFRSELVTSNGSQGSELCLRLTSAGRKESAGGS